MPCSILIPDYALPTFITTTPQSNLRIRDCYFHFIDDKTEAWII